MSPSTVTMTAEPTDDPTGSSARRHVIRTTPFVHTQISMKDGEGSAYVPRDHSLWLADDSSDAIFEVAPRTGRLKRVISEQEFWFTDRFGGGPPAGGNRTDDFESMAYDAANDALYVFSGKCCRGSVRPTAFRLTRRRGVLRLDSWEPLKRTNDFTAAGWNSADHRLYVAVDSDLRTYNYPQNALGQPFQITDLTGILGLDFSRDGSKMYAVTNHRMLHVVDWPSRTIIPGRSFDLTPFGVRDSRAVERIRGRFFVLDGAPRPGDDRLEYAVFESDVER
jgi:sugar lactone lactonase YvrE